MGVEPQKNVWFLKNIWSLIIVVIALFVVVLGVWYYSSSTPSLVPSDQLPPTGGNSALAPEDAEIVEDVNSLNIEDLDAEMESIEREIAQ